MRTNSLVHIALFSLAVFLAGLFPRMADAVDITTGTETGLDYYLTVSPSHPQVGASVTISLVPKPGLPAIGAVNWTLSGAPSSNANVVPGSPTMYSFTPNTPGSYFIDANFRDPRGGNTTATMELVIGAGLPDVTTFPVPPGYTAGQPVSPDQLYITVEPNQPNIGQPVIFTLHFPGGFHQGTQVRWEFAGGPITNQSSSGVHNEVCVFTPSAQTSYYVRAAVVDQRGYMTGEVSLGFFLIP